MKRPRLFGKKPSLSKSRVRSRRLRESRFARTYEKLEGRNLLTGVLTQANPGYFATWDGGEILSTDVAGITFEGGNLFPDTR